jgi:hypothetical protein
MADEDEVDPALPVALSAQRHRPDDDDELRPHTFETLKYEQVVVRASGFLYRGTLIGADESDLYLKTVTRWVVLPLDHVTSVKPDDASRRPLGLPGWLDDDDDDDRGAP